MTHPSTLLPDRGVLCVLGVDAHSFLQGLISNDIRKVSPHHAIFAALLTPQGKFLHDFFIVQQEDALLLETERTRLDELQARLVKYKLRAKVVISTRPELQVGAVWGHGTGVRGEIKGEEVIYGDPRLSAMGQRVIGEHLVLPDRRQEYEHHRISLGVPDGAHDLTPDRSLLLEYGYDALGAVDFTKGCYVGQEVTARTRHRATLHKHIFQVSGHAPLPPAGTPVMVGERQVGEMRSSSGDVGLAMLRVEDVQKAHHEQLLLKAGEVTLEDAHLPLWSRIGHAGS